jgi:hypothetical protein
LSVLVHLKPPIGHRHPRRQKPTTVASSKESSRPFSLAGGSISPIADNRSKQSHPIAYDGTGKVFLRFLQSWERVSDGPSACFCLRQGPLLLIRPQRIPSTGYFSFSLHITKSLICHHVYR